MNLVNKLSGYKTYISGVVLAVIGVVNAFHSSHLDFANLSTIVGGLGVIPSFRAAIAKVEAALKASKV
jgi:uncharacterized membrane protein